MIIHGQEYFQVSVKTEEAFGKAPYKELREIRKNWWKKINAKFPDFEKGHRTRAAAEKTAEKIKKIFPDAPIEVCPMCDLYF